MAHINGNEVLFSAHLHLTPNVVQETGESTVDVMSQDAVTKALEAKIGKDDIVNSLDETNAATKALAASAGYAISKDLQDFKTAVNTILYSDEETLDTVQEIVDEVKNNKTSIDAIIADKISKDDIVTDLETDEATKVLAASAGYALNEKIKSFEVNLGDGSSVVLINGNVRNGEGEDSIRQKNASATGKNSSAFGNETVAEGEDSHSEGGYTHANGKRSHAEGNDTKTFGIGSHSEGVWTVAYGADGSHAEGYKTTALGTNSHAEGMSGSSKDPQVYNSNLITDRTKTVEEVAALHNGTRDTGEALDGHYFTLAYEMGTHAEGRSTVACGKHSHSEGQITFAGGENSHTEGYATVAYGKNQHVQGSCNVIDKDGKYAHILGNGKYNSTTKMFERSNAHTVDWEGNVWFRGDVRTGNENYDTGDSLVKVNDIKTLLQTPVRVDATVVIKNASLLTGADICIAFSYHSQDVASATRDNILYLINDIYASYQRFVFPVTVWEYGNDGTPILYPSGIMYFVGEGANRVLRLTYAQIRNAVYEMINIDLGKENKDSIVITTYAHKLADYKNNPFKET